MRKIQILTHSGENQNKLSEAEYLVSTLHDARAFDEYDINIINLNSEKIWINSGKSKDTINIINDIYSVSMMLEITKTSTVIVVLPQNLNYRYNFYNKEYKYKAELKDLINNWKLICSKIFGYYNDYEIFYGNTNTRIMNKSTKASFHFGEDYDSNGIYQQSLLSSEVSNKPTAVKIGNKYKKNEIILTTLDLDDQSVIPTFLEAIGLFEKNKKIPEWMSEISMFDDLDQQENIEEQKKIINEAENRILEAKEIIDKNKYYESVLYKSGEELVEVIFDILQDMLKCDLSEFVDEKKEDFHFEKSGKVYIGEIKGVNDNIKSQNVSQLEQHRTIYIDEHPDIDEESIRCLLIMNHQRKKRISEREKVHDTQIKLAKKYGSLIIDTYTLLKLYEQYKKNSLNTETCLALLTDNIGILDLQENNICQNEPVKEEIL